MRKYMIAAGVLALVVSIFLAPAFSQNISAVLNGTVRDPAGSAVPNANIILTNQETSAALTSSTNEAGIFVYSSVLPGVYSLEVSSAGFRTYQVRDLRLTMNERRSLGDIVLQVGQLQERVEVTAEVTPVQTASSERAGLVAGAQLLNTAIRGRDFVALIATLPGIVDNNMQSRDVSKGPGAGGLHINGGRDTSINFALDGIQDTDTGSNSGSHVQPNMDAVAEVKVLTSNYQAEYGRSSAGTINVTVKNGTQDFHGSGYWYYRNESLYANSFFRNRTGTPRPIERIRNYGYTIGGPVYGGGFNKAKDKLFFFWSQEFVRRQNYPGTQFVTTPTQLERNGDFSQTRDVNGALIPIKDPVTGQPFANNMIPQSRISKQGLAILNFFPMPNYTEADPALRYTRNYRSNVSGSFPRREDLFRIDYNISPTLNAYFRGTEDNDDENWPYSNWTAGSHNFDLGNTYRWQHGRSALLHVTKTFSPTLVNEFTMGASTRGQAFNPSDPSKVARSTMGNIGQWYPGGNESGAIPDVSFGGVQNAINGGLGNIPYHNENPVFTWVDNVSKVLGTHTLKFGAYIERMRKDEVGGGNTRGSFDFGRNTNNPFDSNYAFSNALLGNFNTYSEANLRTYSLYRYTQAELYAQDSWKVSRRLSVEVGVRFYSSPATHDIRQYLTTFIPSTYDPASAAVLYRPAIDPATKKRAAVDPRTGAVAPVPYIGLFVPGSGNYAPGMGIGGKNGVPDGLYSTPFSFAPRLGFAYDPKGDGKTAIRGGFGIFYDRPQGNVYSGTVGQPPVSYNPTVSFGNLDNFLQATGVVGPASVTVVESADQPLPMTMNFSFGIQRELGFHTVIDASYVGSLARHLIVQRNVNSIPMFAHFDAKNVDSTTGSPLPDNYLRPYLGMSTVNMRTFDGTSNYHGLQVMVNRRMSHGIQYGVSYTWSKTLGVSDADFGGMSYYFPMRERNYGPLGYDIRHMLMVNYNWDLPNLGKKVNNRILGAVTDNWQLSGITAAMTGTPQFRLVSAQSDGADITGSQEGARMDIIGDPSLANSDFYHNFNVAAFARPTKGTFGTAGVGFLRNSAWSNWDMSLSKRIPWKGEERYFQLRGEFYNAWNHTEFSGYDTSFRFNPQGQQISANVGAYNGTRDPRKIQLSLRLMF